MISKMHGGSMRLMWIETAFEVGLPLHRGTHDSLRSILYSHLKIVVTRWHTCRKLSLVFLVYSYIFKITRKIISQL